LSNLPTGKDSYLTVVSGQPHFEGTFEGFVLLNEDERRVFSCARRAWRKDLPAHRRQALEALIDAYKADFVLTKTAEMLNREGLA
jgi:hypothetical protein